MYFFSGKKPRGERTTSFGVLERRKSEHIAECGDGRGGYSGAAAIEHVKIWISCVRRVSRSLTRTCIPSKTTTLPHVSSKQTKQRGSVPP